MPRPDPAAHVIDVARGTSSRTVAGVLAAGGSGAFAVFAATTGRVSGGRVAEVFALTLGGVLLVIAIAGLLAWRLVTRPRTLVFDRSGVRWRDPRGTSWSADWDEVAAISISRTVNRRPKLLPPDVMVRLDLFPATPDFRERHPEMEHLWEFHRVRGGYRVPLGQAGELVPHLDAAMRRHAGARYSGVQDEGFTVGLF